MALCVRVCARVNDGDCLRARKNDCMSVCVVVREYEYMRERERERDRECVGVLEREDQCVSECVYVRERVIARALTSVCMCG